MRKCVFVYRFNVFIKKQKKGHLISLKSPFCESSFFLPSSFSNFYNFFRPFYRIPFLSAYRVHPVLMILRVEYNYKTGLRFHVATVLCTIIIIVITTQLSVSSIHNNIFQVYVCPPHIHIIRFRMDYRRNDGKFRTRIKSTKSIFSVHIHYF